MFLKVQSDITYTQQHRQVYSKSCIKQKRRMNIPRYIDNQVHFGSASYSQKIDATLDGVNQLMGALFSMLKRNHNSPKISFRTAKGNKVRISRFASTDRIKVTTRDRKKIITFELKHNGILMKPYDQAKSLVTVFIKQKKFGLFGKNVYKTKKRKVNLADAIIIKHYANEAFDIAKGINPR